MTWELIRLKVVRSAALELGGTVAVRSLSFLRIFVIARLFVPEDYGAYSTALLILAVPLLFAQAGLRQYVVKCDDDELDRAFGTAVLLSLVVATVLVGITAASAPFLGRVLDDPGLAPVLVLMSLGILDIMLQMPLALWDREFRFGASKLPELLGGVAGILLIVGLDAGGVAPVWAMAWGYLATMGLRGGLLWLWAPSRPPLRFDPEQARKQIRFGLPLLAAAGTGYVAARGDDLGVRYLYGNETLGLYTLAFYVPALLQEIVWGIDRVSLPAFAELQGRRDELRAAFNASVRYSAALAAPVGLGLAAFSGPLVTLIFGPEWSRAAPLLALFAVAFALRASTGLNWGALAMVADRTGYMAGVSAATAVFMLVVGLPLIWWLGAVGGAVYALAQVVVMGPVVRIPLIRDVVGDLSFFRGTWRPLLVAGGLAAACRLLGLHEVAGWWSLAIFAGFVVASGALILLLDPRLREAVRGLVAGEGE